MAFPKKKVVLLLALLGTVLFRYSAYSSEDQDYDKPIAFELSGRLEITEEIASFQTDEEIYSLYAIPGTFPEDDEFPFEQQEVYIIEGFRTARGFIVYEIAFAEREDSFRDEENRPLMVSVLPGVSYSVDRRLCISCRLCIPNCPVGAISMSRGVAVIDQDICISCGICKDGDAKDFAGCPVDAVKKESPDR